MGKTVHISNRVYKPKDVAPGTYVSDRVYTPKQAARQLGISEAMVRRLLGRGDLPHRRLGKLIRLTGTDLDDCLENAKVDVR